MELALPIGSQLDVEYIGRMCLAADFGDTAIGMANCWGFITFRPSDVVGERYELALAYPTSVTLDDKKFNLEVIAAASGCQLIREALEHKPTILPDPKGGWIATIEVPGPLTDLHQLSLVWKGSAG
jgi:hypothetical protein